MSFDQRLLHLHTERNGTDTTNNGAACQKR